MNELKRDLVFLHVEMEKEKERYLKGAGESFSVKVKVRNQIANKIDISKKSITREWDTY